MQEVKNEIDGIQVQRREYQQSYEMEIASLKMQARKKDEEMNLVRQEMEQQYQQAVTEAIAKRNKEFEEQLAVQKRVADALKEEQWKLEDRLKQKDHELVLLQNEVEEKFRAKEDKLWASEMELNTLRDKCATFKKSIDDRKSELAHMKDQVQIGADRESELRKELLKIQLQTEKDAEERERKIATQYQQQLKVVERQRDEALQLVQDRNEQVEHLKQQQKQNEKYLEQIKVQEQRRAEQNVTREKYNQVRRTMEKNIDSEFGLGSLPSSPSSFVQDMSAMNQQQQQQYHAQPSTSPMHKQAQMNHAMYASKEAHFNNNGTDQLMKQMLDRIEQLTEQLENIKRKDGYGDASERITILNSQLTEEKEMTEQLREALNNHKQENKLLKSKLKDAARDLKKLMKEREKLIDISINLKQQLTRAMQEQPTATITTNQAPKTMDDATQKYHEMIQRYEVRIHELEQSCKIYRRELEKWTGNQFEPKDLLDQPYESQHVPLYADTYLMNQEMQQSRPRQKLDELRESLTLKGTTVKQVERPKSATTNTTKKKR